jgi:hypothetical protein
MLVVEPGLAVDPLGRDIWVDRDLCIDIAQLPPSFWEQLEAPGEGQAFPGDAERRAHVVLRFLSCQGEPVPAVTPPCADEADHVAYSRIYERYRVDLEATAPADPHELQREWLAAIEAGPEGGSESGGESSGDEGESGAQPFAPDSDDDEDSSSATDWANALPNDSLRDRLLRWALDDAPRLSGLWNDARFEPAGVLLATVYLRFDSNSQKTRVVLIDNAVRALLPPVQLVAEQLTGHRLIGANGAERLRVRSIEAVTPEGEEALRLAVTLSEPFLASSAKQGSVSLRRLLGVGWSEAPTEVTADAESKQLLVVSKKDAKWADATHWQLVIRGAGMDPLMGASGPLAGWWDEPLPRPGRGVDVSLVGPHEATS